MTTRKKKSKKKLVRDNRLNNAKRWLHKHPQKNLLAAYTKRYGVDPDIARDELMQLGFYDELCIQSYDKEGIDWEYRVEPLSGEMFVVP
ncbi:hypothetical protein, partial [Desulfoplanes sp.]